MKKIYALLTALLLTIAATAQTLNVQVGSVTYQFPASQCGEMTYTDGTTLTIMNKAFTLSDISAMTIDETEVADGTVIAVGGLESGASISGGTCKSASSWTASSWHALYNGSGLALAFKTPASSSSGGNQGGPGGGGPGGNQGGSSQQLVVYTTSTPSLKSGVTVSGGTEYFGGMANIGCTVSGGSTVTLSTYSGGNSGPGGH